MPVKTNTTNTDATTPKKTTTVKKVRVVKKKVVAKKEDEATKAVVENVAPEEPVVVTPPPVENAIEKEETLTAAAETEAPIEEEESTSDSGDKKKIKKTLKKEDFISKFDYLFSAYEEQLKAARKQPNQSVSLHKYLTSLKNDVYKILKLKKRKAGENSAASGFMKPVSVSSELRDFLGNLNADEEITRVLVTRKLCEYIKQNSLQQNEDKRFIIPDSKLKSLFAIAENDNDTKLSYYGMQQLIQRHISKKTVENTSS